MDAKYWMKKSLKDLTQEEWEALCDGCGQCCLFRLEDEDTGEIFTTNIACKLLCHETCTCLDYSHRFEIIPNCLQLSSENVAKLSWLPRTCAYRLVSVHMDLPEWHPLKTGRSESVHQAGISVKGKIISEELVDSEQYFDYVVDWWDE